ncbi:PaaI family thioesterase [Mycobacteroides franklinii]|uniref:Putative esterase n=1 Tax=Mycobacteroides franklinii TaxID=948102 RepID=A0A4R8RE32_9MYCO|nr:PaaI family thioesterase [Mycobacteroides franklinii]TDZ45975.1 putative esterase [Mycobacteroides franklinii]TDZ53590.1 putative esterase [Mycobacteroides franklinii]TDZ59645.1 putative esterase [Mycobacteroides franklinii]TDZ67160.1 putative esterase [Mycobacteroides franklinii]TDZ73084.1 putative esterase [Mycobacteroides franklinii]
MPTRTEIITQFVPNSPLCQHLGITLTEIGNDRAVLAMPFKPELATMGHTVYGGAIATLADTAAMAAAWADDTVPEKFGGSTASLTVNYVSAADATDLTAVGQVVRRGKRLSNIEVTVADPAGRVVAKALATYNFA